MITIAVINRKGGVGKTTMAAHMAGGLATLGYNVALVDTDPQGNAATILGMEKENGIYNLLVEKQPISDVIRPVPVEAYATNDNPPAGTFWLVPSDTDTYIVPLKVQSALSLRTKIREMGRLFELDAVIIDTAPTASMFDGAVYFAADGVVYVTECETLSLDGLREGLDQLSAHQEERSEVGMQKLPVLGILPNKLPAKTKTHKDWLGELGESYPGLVWSPIPQRTLWTDATRYGQLLFSYAPTSGVTEAAWEIVDRVKGVVDQWVGV